MNDDDVWGGEMPNLPFRRRHGDPADAPQLDELLDAGRLDAVPAAEWQSVSDLLRSAAAAAEPSELVGEAAILAAFRRERAGIRHRRPQTIARYKTVLSTRPFSTLLTGRIAAGLAAGTVIITGAATAAYACVLPTPIQSFAHDTIGAPAPAGSTVSAVDADQHHWKSNDPSVSPSATSTVTATATASVTPASKPKATASAAAAVHALVLYRTCQAYTAATNAGKTLNPQELSGLTKAAGSATAIAAYCAALPVPPMPVCWSPLHPTATASVSPSLTPTTSANTLKRGWWPWCGICPPLKTPTGVSPSPSTSATADASRHAFCFGFGDRDGARSHLVVPLATPKPKPTATYSHGPGFGFGPGSDGNHQGFGGAGSSSDQHDNSDQHNHTSK